MFVVTEEVYQRTFEEIEAVIAGLNAIIRAGDFARVGEAPDGRLP